MGVIITKIGNRQDVPYLMAYHKAVFCLSLNGINLFIDEYDGSVWSWDDYNNITDVLSIIDLSNKLIPMISINDCILTERSYFHDKTQGCLFVHWEDNVNDFTVDRTTSIISIFTSGWASGKTDGYNVFEGNHYSPVIIGLSGFSRKVDPLKLGLIEDDQSTLTISDSVIDYRYSSKSSAFGIPIWVYYVDESATALTDDDLIAVGSLNGYTHNGDSITYKIKSNRYFENKSVCVSKMDASVYPNIGDLENELKPVVWGDVSRGRMILTNQNALDTDSSGTAVFLIADDTLGYALTSIDALYDKEDNEITITSSDINACTITATKAAGVSVSDLNDWKWKGKGYDIDGDYNNGLDIVRSVMLKRSELPYTASVFDTVEWNAQTILNNQPCGVSIQSDKGYFEEVIEKICASLQGSVIVNGKGKVSFASSDRTKAVSQVFMKENQLDIPDIEMSADDTVSEVIVEYAPDYVKNSAKQIIYSNDREDTIRNYAIDRREPISPLKTILFNKADAVAIAAQVMETSADPERKIRLQAKGIYKEINIFDIIDVDTQSYDGEEMERAEVLYFQPDYLNNTQTITARTI
jgi:hypothetical protein